MDGNSQDRTCDIAEKYNAKIVYEAGRLGKARQKGIEVSSGAIIGIFDSDIYFPSKDWLSSAVNDFEDKKLGILWPLNVAPKKTTWVSKCYFNFWNARLKTHSSAVPGGNILVRREAFIKSGGFNTRLHWGEDFDLSCRILSEGYTVKISDRWIIHDSMRSLKEFLKKQIIGASTIIPYKDRCVEIDLLYVCMTWKAAPKLTSSFIRLVNAVIFDQIYIGFKSMYNGLRMKEPSWIVFPLLLFIRILVYVPIYLFHSFRFKDY